MKNCEMYHRIYYKDNEIHIIHLTCHGEYEYDEKYWITKDIFCDKLDDYNNHVNTGYYDAYKWLETKIQNHSKQIPSKLFISIKKYLNDHSACEFCYRNCDHDESEEKIYTNILDNLSDE